MLEEAGLDEPIDIGRIMMSPDQVGALLAGAGFGGMELETRELALRWDSAAAAARGVAGTPFQAFVSTLAPERLGEVMAELERAVGATTGPDGGFTMSAVLGRGVA